MTKYGDNKCLECEHNRGCYMHAISCEQFGAEFICLKDETIEQENERLHSIIKEAREYIEELLREEFEITDTDSVDYGTKCQRAYFSDSELGKVLEILDKGE